MDLPVNQLGPGWRSARDTKGPAKRLRTERAGNAPIAQSPVNGKLTEASPSHEEQLFLAFGCILTEYQLAGDTEGHGVPEPPRRAD